MLFCLPHDLVNLVLTFELQISPLELSEDIDYFVTWHNTVPSLFLSPRLLDTRYLFFVPSPMLVNHPYTPRRHLAMRPADIWSQTLPAFGQMICRERIREVRSYKKCILRWIYDCVENRDVGYYTILYSKILRKLSPLHFRPSAHWVFVREALRQIEDVLPS